MKYEIIKVANKIYWAKFENNYDLAMTFCRMQEFYENSSDQFRGKKFTIIDFMEYYAREFGDGAFTYTKDWGGFNIPARIIDEVFDLGIDDRNKYDDEMLNIHTKINEKDYYLIGSCGENLDPHEFAHALFYSNEQYRSDMNKCIDNMWAEDRSSVCEWLDKKSYAESVYDDETQAYLSTSYGFHIKGNSEKGWGKICESFREVYKKHNKDVAMLAEYWKEMGK
jgi:hypothetical protein